MMRLMCQSLEKLLLAEEKKNRAAKLILTRAKKIPAQQVQQRLKFLSEGRHYSEELKCLAQHPELLQHLLETTRSLILQHYKGSCCIILFISTKLNPYLSWCL